MTKEQQIKIQRCIDEFYFNRPQVRDELGAALQVLYEAEPVKHGHWIVVSEYPKKAECSHCGYPIEHELVCWWNYCPNCGAKMFDKDIDVHDKNVGKMDEVEDNGRV